VAVAFDAASSASSLAQPASLTVSHTCTGANGYLLAIVGLTSGALGNVTSVTYNGVSMGTALWNATVGGIRCAGFGLKNPATGAHNLVANVSGANDGFSLQGVSFNGVDQTTPAGTPNSASNGVSSTATVNIASAAGELVVDGLATGALGTITIGGGQTLRDSILVTGEHSGRSSEEAGAASVTMSWTWATGATSWAMGGVSLKPAAAGGQVPYQPNYQRAPLLAH
jgi:hypothetical protein